MPRKPIDYSKGFIYKLCCKDKNIQECYIGSSTNWINRKNNHKTDCNNSNQKKYNQKKYVFIRDNGGWENWEMILIHDYSCNNSQELRKEEERVRQEYHNNINSQRAYITDKELKEHHKQYRINNRDKRSEYHKQYHIDNRDKRSEYNKQNYIDNRDKILQQKKQYNIDNKEKIRQKITCECGCVIVRGNISTHKKTNKHKELMEQNNN